MFITHENEQNNVCLKGIVQAVEWCESEWHELQASNIGKQNHILYPPGQVRQRSKKEDLHRQLNLNQLHLYFVDR